MTLPIKMEIVRLRHITMQDAMEYIALEASEEAQAFVGGPKNKTVENVEAYIARREVGNLNVLVVEDWETGRFLGRAGLLPRLDCPAELEVHCVLKKEAQRKGYGIATFRGLIWLAATLGKEPVAVIHPGNIPSLRLFDKLGFVRTGVKNNGHLIYHCTTRV